MVGWIKLHKRIMDWEWYGDTNTFKVFIHCLLKANHEPKKWQGIVINRGTFVTSLEKLSIETNLSIQKIRTSISKLKVNKQITSTSTNKYTIITICKYEPYQARVVEGQQTGITKVNKQITTTKEIKNKEERIIKEKYIKRKNIPTKKDMVDYAKEKKIPLDVAGECYYYYDKIGWIVGKDKKPIESWKSALSGWWLREKKKRKSGIAKDTGRYSRTNYGEDNIKSLGDVFKSLK